jgi:hypothetical protein
VSRLALRSHYWGALVVVVASGELDAEGAERLRPLLQKLQNGTDVVIDLWDLTGCDAEGVAALQVAITRAQEAGWGFAIVADPAGPCVEALASNGYADTIPTFADRQAARAALNNSAS